MALPIGAQAPNFSLPGVDGQDYTLDSFADKQAVVLIFSCNHCPMVVSNEDRMIKLQADYADRGVQLVAICSNNEVTHPADSFEKMKERAAEKGFNFPYLRDETQEVAKAFGATVTPEIFLLDAERKVVYHGRIDDSPRTEAEVGRQDLREALDALLAGEEIEVPMTEPVGCTIKWK